MNNVLIIDDQPLYSEALASLVQTAFQSVNAVESTDSAEVMEIIRNQPVDLVILDVVLGDRDGMRLAKEHISDRLPRQNLVYFFSRLLELVKSRI